MLSELFSYLIDGLFLLGVIISLLGSAYFLHARLKIAAALAPISVVSLIIVILYPAVFLGILQPVSRLCFYAGFLLPMGEWVAAVRRERKSTPDVRTAIWWATVEMLRFFARPSTFLFTACLLLLCVKLAGVQFHNWDEFTHWGLSSKAMIGTDALPNARFPIHFMSYPPGVNLFHYFVFTNVVGDGEVVIEREWILVAAHTLLLLLPLAVLFDRLSWREWPQAVLIVGGAIVILERLGHGLDSVLIDHVLSVFFSMAIVGYFVLKRERRNLLILLPILSVLPLLKDAGVVLALFAAGLIGVDLILTGPARHWRTWAVIVLIFLAPYAARASWIGHLDSNEFSRRFNFSQVNAAEVMQAFGPEASEYAKEVRHNFITAMLSREQGLKWGMMFLLLAGACLVTPADLLSRRSRAILVISLGAGFILYTLGQLIAYLFLFSEFEGRLLASFGRYIDIYLASIGLIVLYLATAPSEEELPRPVKPNRFLIAGGLWLTAAALLIVSQIKEPQVESAWKLLRTYSAAICFVFVYLLWKSKSMKFERLSQRRIAASIRLQKIMTATLLVHLAFYGFANVNRYRTPLRTGASPQWSFIREVVSPTENVFSVWQNTKGFESFITGYELCPRQTNFWGWSVGAPYFEGDVWTVNRSAEDFRKLISEYDYLYLGTVDEQFWRHCGKLFAETDRKTDTFLYRIEKASQENVRLRPLSAETLSHMHLN